MIQGVGTDIIEIKRVEKAIQRHGKRFLDRLFSSKEQAYCDKHKLSSRHYAGRFAAKEAIAKALGTGFGESLGWLDFEILNETSGKPQVLFSDLLKERLNGAKLHLSISHSQDYATATAILEG